MFTPTASLQFYVFHGNQQRSKTPCITPSLMSIDQRKSQQLNKSYQVKLKIIVGFS